jgi:hypothetical protein
MVHNESSLRLNWLVRKIQPILLVIAPPYLF